MTKIKLKQCTFCKRFKDATPEFFYRRTASYDGLKSQCKVCIAKNTDKQAKAEYNKKWTKTKNGKESLKASVKKYQQSSKGKAALNRAYKNWLIKKEGKDER